MLHTSLSCNFTTVVTKLALHGDCPRNVCKVSGNRFVSYFLLVVVLVEVLFSKLIKYFVHGSIDRSIGFLFI